MESIKGGQQGSTYINVGKTGKKTIGLNISIYIDTDVTRQELPNTNISAEAKLSQKKYGMSVGTYRVLNPIRNNLAKRVNMQSLVKKYLGDSKTYIKMINIKGADKVNAKQHQILSTLILLLKNIHSRLELHNMQKLQRSIEIRKQEAMIQKSTKTDT